MGMFDYVLIEGHELPGIDPERLERAHRTEKEGGQEDLAGKPVVFQTKDLENYLGTYVIKDGRLYERIYEHEDVPEAESPYYGRPEWDEGGGRSSARTSTGAAGPGGSSATTTKTWNTTAIWSSMPAEKAWDSPRSTERGS